MNILNVSGIRYIPQQTGGVESTIDELSLALAARGHRGSVACALSKAGLVGLWGRGLSKAFNVPFVKDNLLGYPTYRCRDLERGIAAVVDEVKPDFAIVHNSLPAARLIERLGVPFLCYFHNVEAETLRGGPPVWAMCGYVANSQFTAERVHELFGLRCAVVPPLFAAARYRVARKGAQVTFVNPDRRKGLELALALAQSCPEIKFVFIESWELWKRNRKDLSKRLKALPNVTLRGNTRNMRLVYRDTKILLVPSVWEETWGRVVTEAQFSGIPVLASDRGGLPESVGPGGVLLSVDAPLDHWVQALRRMWSDKTYCAKLSAAALSHSRRAALNPDTQIDTLLEQGQLVAARRCEMVQAAK